MKTNPHSSISLSLSHQLFSLPAIFHNIDDDHVVNLTVIQVGVKATQKKKNVRAETGKMFVFVQISNPHRKLNYCYCSSFR